MGRKRLPTHLKLVKGTARGAILKRKRDDIEPEQLPYVPEPPPNLNETGKAEWQRVAPGLHALKILTSMDIGALTAYCQAWATYKEASELFYAMARNDASRGFLIKTKKENVIQNPLLGVMNKALHDLVYYAAEFGMTPSARARINTGGQNTPDPTDKYFA